MYIYIRMTAIRYLKNRYDEINNRLNIELHKGEERDELMRRLVQTFYKQRFDSIKIENGNAIFRLRLKNHMAFRISVKYLSKQEIICYINMFLLPSEEIPLNICGMIEVNDVFYGSSGSGSVSTFIFSSDSDTD